MRHSTIRYNPQRAQQPDPADRPDRSAQERLDRPATPSGPRAPALLISRLVSWVDDLWCRAIGAGV
nr:PE family protein [Mycobacterium pseudoshottsii]